MGNRSVNLKTLFRGKKKVLLLYIHVLLCIHLLKSARKNLK